jgi:hypothetical protein
MVLLTCIMPRPAGPCPLSPYLGELQRADKLRELCGAVRPHVCPLLMQASPSSPSFLPVQRRAAWWQRHAQHPRVPTVITSAHAGSLARHWMRSGAPRPEAAASLLGGISLPWCARPCSGSQCAHWCVGQLLFVPLFSCAGGTGGPFSSTRWGALPSCQRSPQSVAPSQAVKGEGR